MKSREHDDLDETGETEDESLQAAVREAESIPDELLAAAEGRVPVERAFPDPRRSEAETAELRELFRPLEPAARERVIENAMHMLLPTRAGGRRSENSGAPPPAPNVVVPLADAKKRRRSWLVWAPVAAAAAALLLVFTRDTSDPLAAYQNAEVRLSSTLRAGPEAAVPQATLSLRSGDHFLLNCHVPGKRMKVEGVRSIQVGADTPQTEKWFVGGEIRDATDEGVVLRVRADLPRGRWEVTCKAVDLDSGRPVVLGPAAVLDVQ